MRLINFMGMLPIILIHERRDEDLQMLFTALVLTLAIVRVLFQYEAVVEFRSGLAPTGGNYMHLNYPKQGV